METMNILLNRKSIKSYTGERISEEVLKKILKVAQSCPVGMAKYENLHLTVVEKPGFLQGLEAACAKMLGNPDAHPLYGAPTLILVSAKGGPGGCGNVEFSNAAIMAHTMALAAMDLSVGACYIWGAIRTLNQTPDLVKELDLPEGFTPCCAVILGLSTEQYAIREIPDDRIAVSYLK